jgi:glycosyltransferase involved in cell wall biosynthesis
MPLIIQLCRNTLTYSKACLKTLLAQTVPVDILLVDNASSDGTTQWAASQQALHSNVLRVTYQEVESVACCWNRALDWAWKRGYDEALVVNSDTELLPCTYQRLDEYLTKGGMITGISVDRPPVEPEQITLNNHSDYSCFMIACWAHRQVPFDEGYAGAYFEDNDHHVRMHRAGIAANGTNLEFLHHRSTTLRLADKNERERITYHYDRNKLRFLNEYGCLPGTKGYAELFLPPDV